MFTAYKLLHIAGLALLMMSLGALTLHAALGGTRESAPARPLLFASHGVALVLLLVTGFGMLARLELSYGGVWIWLKVALWIVLALLVALPLRAPQAARLLWPLLPVLAAAAGYLAFEKPGA